MNLATDMSMRTSQRWEDLPLDIIGAVVKHLDLFSTARAAAVCTSWFEGVRRDPTLPFGYPCLLKERDYYDDDGLDPQDQEFELLSFGRWCDRDQDTLPPVILDGVLLGRLVGGKDDWLASVDERGDAWLANPYSGERIAMPDIATVVPDKTRDTISRIVLGVTPYEDADGSGGYIAVAVLYTDELYVARGGRRSVGDVGWTPLRTPRGVDESRVYFCFSDVIVHKGRVFAVDGCGSVYVWDLNRGTAARVTGPDAGDYAPPTIIKPPDVGDLVEEQGFETAWRLAESVDGNRLLIACVYGYVVEVYAPTGRYLEYRVVFSYDHVQNQGVRLYERDVDATDGGCWSVVESIGENKSLFLGINHPFTATIVDQEPSTWQPALRSNYVYVTDNGQWGSQSPENVIQGFDLRDGGQLRMSRTIYRDMLFTNQAPIWFMPLLKV
jgi:hypothetical protein